MNLIKLAIKNLKFRWLNNLLSTLLLSLGLGLLLVVNEVSKQAEKKLENNLAGIDLVIGAKGSPLQLILSSIYHIDAPTGNISYKHAMKWAQNPMISEAVPLAFGDNFQGYKIVGTNHLYLDWYQAKLSQGKLWNNDLEVVLGSEVAKNSKLKIGDHFKGAHGLDDIEEEEGDDHGDYVVTGILDQSGTVIDQLVLCSIGSVWEVHHEHNSESHDFEDAEITSLLLKYKTPRAAILLPRNINENTLMQAAAPAIEINRVYYLLHSGTESISWIAYGILGLALVSLFIQTWIGINNRKHELALLRSFGLKAGALIQLLLFEIVLLVSFGFIMGEVLSRAFLLTFSDDLGYGEAYSLSVGQLNSFDLILFLTSLVIASIAVLLQSGKIYRLDIPDLLMNDR